MMSLMGLDGKAWARAVNAGAALLLIVADREAGILHAERIEQALLLELKERLSGNHFDHTPENIGRMAVVPGRSRLVDQRQPGHDGGGRSRAELVRLLRAAGLTPQP